MTYFVDDTDVDESFAKMVLWRRRNRVDGTSWRWNWWSWRTWRSRAFTNWNTQASLRTRHLGLTNWDVRIFDRIFRIRSWFCSNCISTRNFRQICEQTILISLSLLIQIDRVTRCKYLLRKLARIPNRVLRIFLDLGAGAGVGARTGAGAGLSSSNTTCA